MGELSLLRAWLTRLREAKELAKVLEEAAAKRDSTRKLAELRVKRKESA